MSLELPSLTSFAIDWVTRGRLDDKSLFLIKIICFECLTIFSQGLNFLLLYKFQQKTTEIYPEG
jgi:hypothetical protein